jgi:hypothetical protein
MPDLEELALPHDHYHLSTDYCQQWKRRMDWGLLRRLGLGEGCPHYLFAALTGEVPHLKRWRLASGRDTLVTR